MSQDATSPPGPGPTDVLEPARPVASRILGERALLLHPRADEVKLTNEVGTVVWQLVCERRHTLESIAAAIVETFEVDDATARADVASFLKALAEGGFLAWHAPPVNSSSD